MVPLIWKSAQSLFLLFGSFFSLHELLSLDLLHVALGFYIVYLLGMQTERLVTMNKEKPREDESPTSNILDDVLGSMSSTFTIHKPCCKKAWF